MKERTDPTVPIPVKECKPIQSINTIIPIPMKECTDPTVPIPLKNVQPIQSTNSTIQIPIKERSTHPVHQHHHSNPHQRAFNPSSPPKPPSQFQSKSVTPPKKPPKRMS
ncbi:hypothetical protein EJ06DRAFT_417424 [Trichodelitschia bisporula]|uniref:Uncharacterized protein n=1 Tax=Trichodelitschia bisporula TaxID=703511 RepID=A0A6G1HYB8_9PEZI|nr:hypothetical protein EJ06DRAFT_417424 [Trichodelitschia bisporula]